jgi:hypothetical protein
MNAKEVMNSARRRTRTPSSAASTRAPNMAMGVASRTANGSVQLSYRAAMSKNTTSTENAITVLAGTP